MKVAAVFCFLAFWGAVRTCAVEERVVSRTLQKEAQAIKSESNAARNARQIGGRIKVSEFLDEAAPFLNLVDLWIQYRLEKAEFERYTAEVLDADQRPELVVALQSLFSGHELPAEVVEMLIVNGKAGQFELDETSFTVLYFKFSPGFFSAASIRVLEESSCDEGMLARIEDILTRRTLSFDNRL